MQFFGKSDKGLKRRENQDSFVTEQLYETALLCIVCDGMGGANGGKIASTLADSTFLKHVKKKLSDYDGQNQLRFNGEDAEIEKALKKAAANANSAVFRQATKDKELSGMGTTLVSALILDDTLYVTHVGDSRLYYVYPDKMVQITRDHSYVQTLIDLGQITPEEASSNPHKNIITKAIGTQKKIEPDIIFKNLSEDKPSYLLLCSDGLTNFVNDVAIHSIILESETVEDACNALIDKANENGGGDNITAVLIKTDQTVISETQTEEQTEDGKTDKNVGQNSTEG